MGNFTPVLSQYTPIWLLTSVIRDVVVIERDVARNVGNVGHRRNQGGNGRRFKISGRHSYDPEDV